MFFVLKAFNTVSRRFKEGVEFVRDEFDGTDDHLQNLIDLGHVSPASPADAAAAAVADDKAPLPAADPATDEHKPAVDEPTPAAAVTEEHKTADDPAAAAASPRSAIEASI